LLKPAAIRCNVRPNVPHQHHPIVDHFLIVELAAAVSELTDRRNTERSDRAVRKAQTPLVRCRVVQAKSQTLDAARAAADLQFHDVGPTLPYLAHDRGAVIVGPRGRTGEWVQQSMDMCLPSANLEIKIVLSVRETIVLRVCRALLREPADGRGGGNGSGE
jgi:hypothetical protein